MRVHHAIRESVGGIVSRSQLLSRARVRAYGKAHGFDVRTGEGCISITQDDRGRRILLSAEHAVYARDVLDEFDYYFEAVEPTSSLPCLTVDYSRPRTHRVRGWDLMPVEFPALAEPLATATEYLDFADLKEGQTVLDLGAYSGLTSMLFKEAVGLGCVVAVEVDPTNMKSLRKNINNFRDITGTAPQIAEVAIWGNDQGIEFLSEGNMGSAAASLMNRGRSRTHRVPSVTLSGLALQFDLEDVDFIKADVEGAEFQAFSDADFFKDRHPKIIFEGAGGSGERDHQSVIRVLEVHGYRCQVQDQPGALLPLVTCV